MSDREFRDKVVASLAQLEIQMADVQTRMAAQDRAFADTLRFQHRTLGALSAISVVASALFSFGIGLVKQAFSDK